MGMNRESEYSGVKTLSAPRVMPISSIVKARVSNLKGEELGKVEDIMLDLENGRISFAVLAAGGILGFESRLFAIPWEAFKISLHDKKLILNITKESLDNGPSFNKNNWPDMTDITWLKRVYTYYGYEPYWK